MNSNYSVLALTKQVFKKSIFYVIVITEKKKRNLFKNQKKKSINSRIQPIPVSTSIFAMTNES